MKARKKPTRRSARPAKAKAKAARVVARKSSITEGAKAREAEERLAAALEQQAATSEILRVISGSRSDAQPVFDAIVRSVVKLCDGLFSTAFQYDGELLHIAAQHNISPEGLAELQRAYPARPTRSLVAGRAILERAVVHTPDIELDPESRQAAIARVVGWRSSLAAPMLRDGAPIGVVTVGRAKRGRFSESEIALLKTFADQAVIAVENVRLFKELEGRNRDLTEALEQQTATADILRVISTSPTDLQPVLDAVVRSAARFCGAYDANMFRLEEEGLRSVAHYGPIPVPVDRLVPVVRETVSGRAVLGRRAVHVADAQAEAEEFPVGRAFAQQYGFRTNLSVPLLREGVPMGTINLRRAEVEPFTDQQIKLAETFADQAVIAIENVRLFKELEGRNRDLSEALERQTATSDILQIISSSPTDVQPVFDAIIRSAVTLCDASFGGLHLFDGEQITIDAHSGLPEEELEVLRTVFPFPIRSNSLVGRALLERSPVQVEDVRAMPGYHSPAIQSLARYRTGLAVPMLREGTPIGGLALWRSEVRPFTDRQIELIMTFASQAVIAIENVRLFNELQARTGELTRSVDELTALGDISRALSATLDLDAVLQTIVTRANQLAGTDACTVYEYDERAEEFVMRATHNLDEPVAIALRREPIRRGDGAVGRVAVTREPVQIPDIALEGAYHGALLDLLLQSGTRALLAIPLLREDQVVGGLTVNKKTPGEFAPEVVELLKTFATQSALAIQNAQLFREIADKSRQLEVASQHKSEFLANMSHELRTPLNAIIGFSEVLAEGMFGEVNEKQAEYLKDILESGRHLLSLINDILDLSKIEAGRMELELSDFDLPSAIDNALILVRERASRRGIVLSSDVDERLGTISGDERKVKQVLLNLLSNALKFTPEGGRVNVGARLHDHAAEISVSDTGIGIAQADQAAVFEEFRQVGASDKKAEGTGLGLALSRKFIELHGGRIWVKSELGSGSTFTFTLPLTAARRPSEA